MSLMEVLSHFVVESGESESTAVRRIVPKFVCVPMVPDSKSIIPQMFDELWCYLYRVER